MPAKKPAKKQPPVRIPLDFDATLGGLLKVNPKKPGHAKKSSKKSRHLPEGSKGLPGDGVGKR
jgi:hypothetical protein